MAGRLGRLFWKLRIFCTREEKSAADSFVRSLYLVSSILHLSIRCINYIDAFIEKHRIVDYERKKVTTRLRAKKGDNSRIISFSLTFYLRNAEEI